MDAQVTKNRKTLNSDTFKSIDFEFRHEEKCPPDLPASLFGPSKSWGAELQIPPQNGALFRVFFCEICLVKNVGFGRFFGGPAEILVPLKVSISADARGGTAAEPR